MTDYSTMLALAFKAERAASRKLERASGLDPENALRSTLERSAGAAGLAHLLTDRRALLDAAAVRAAAKLNQKQAALAARRARHDGPPSPWRAWFDGSAHPNPGHCGIGAVLTGPAGQRIELSQDAGYGNSSEAEYQALIAILEQAVRAGVRQLTAYGDSQVVINDVMGGDDAGAASLAHLRRRVRELIAQMESVSLCWIPRHKNGDADRLSQQAARREAVTPAMPA